MTSSASPGTSFPSSSSSSPEPHRLAHKLALSKLGKFERYLAALKENVVIHDPKDIEQARVIEERIGIIERKIARLSFMRTIAYVLLYASLISSLVAGWTWLQYLTRSITFFSSVIGSGVLVLLVVFLTHLIDSHFSDLNLLSSHLIAIYVKHEDEWRPRILEFLEQSF